ncbi:MAG: hypothetical protein LBV43_11605 [Prevotella sp.]|jgi:hypothetical protein|nr:hypothetical protein [Prevotella sp.]
MKKLFLTLILSFSFVAINAQEGNCLGFFPENPGSQLISETFSADGTLLGGTIYNIDQTYDYLSGTDMQIGFAMTDSSGLQISNGTLNAQCIDGVFHLEMATKAMTPEVMDMLSTDTELVGNFLDYPNVFADEDMFGGPFEMDGGDFMIQSKKNRKNFIRVHIFNRQYEGRESVTTPAKTFHAAKISFEFEVTKDKKTTWYKGTEWYAENAGIVRSETRTKDNKLVNYTELTTLIVK